MAKKRTVKTRWIAYRVGKRSNKVLESKALKKEHMARNFVSFWNAQKKCRAFLALHTIEVDHYGVAKLLNSVEVAW